MLTKTFRCGCLEIEEEEARGASRPTASQLGKSPEESGRDSGTSGLISLGDSSQGLKLKDSTRHTTQVVTQLRNRLLGRYP